MAAPDRLSFLDPITLRTIYPSSLHNDFLFRSPSSLFANIQFAPERVVQFSISPEGVRYYKVQWQETWLPEHQLLQYQSLVEAFWRNQNEINTTANITPKGSDIIKPRKDVSNNSEESFLNALQSDTVVLDSSALAAVKSVAESATIVQNIATSSGKSIVSQDNQMGKESSADILKDFAAELNEATTALNTLQSAVVTIDTPADSTDFKIRTPQTARRTKSNTLHLEGFDLVNIENSIATFEDLAVQARETLSSFRRKRVRFPNGSSKLPQTCFFCTKIISNRKKLREHQFSVHFKNVGEFVCGICQQRFVFARQLRAHMITHSDNRNFICKICGLTCKRRSHLHKHMDTHQKERNYRCDVCHKNFKVQADLKDHCLEEHKNEVSKCNVCKQTLHTAFSVYIHSMRHSGTRDYACEICGASFKRKQHLIAHFNVHEETKDKLKCPACDKEFPDRKYFRKHLDQHHKELVQEYRYDYVCPICDKDFAYKGRLDVHMKTHENETEEDIELRLRKKKVDSLSEDALQKLSDKVEKIVDEKTGSVTLKCKLCRRREFRMISSLERHLEEHKSGRLFLKASGSYECDECKKTFYSEGRLSRHKVTHQNNSASLRRQHQCRRCKKNFKWKSCLQVHAKKCVAAINKGAEKRKATLKAKEKFRKQLNDELSSDADEYLLESDMENDDTSKVDSTRTEASKLCDVSVINTSYAETPSTKVLIMKVDGNHIEIVNGTEADLPIMRDDSDQSATKETIEMSVNTENEATKMTSNYESEYADISRHNEKEATEIAGELSEQHFDNVKEPDDHAQRKDSKLDFATSN